MLQETALHFAARKGHLEVVRLLMAFGGEPRPLPPIDTRYPHVEQWFAATKGWGALRIAAGCRDAAAARMVLRSALWRPGPGLALP